VSGAPCSPRAPCSSRAPRPPRALALALAAGLIARLALAAGHGPLASDERDYDALGRTLATTGAYSDDGAPTAYRSIGYPAFVAGVYALAGRSPRAVQAAQTLLDLATALLLYRLLAGRSRRAGTVAAAIWALYPAAILFSGLLFPQTLVVFLLVAFTVLLDRASRRGSGFVLPGAVLGALVLVKPEWLVLAAALAILLLRRGLRARDAAALLASMAVVVAPWAARNQLVFGRLVLSTSFGPNLLIGNNPDATGAYGPALVPARVRSARGESAVDREARNAALEYMASRPGRFLTLGIVKTAHVLSSDAELAVGRFTPAPSPPARYRDRYRSLPIGIHAAVSLPYFVLVLAGILGLVVRPGGVERTVFTALVASVLLVHVVMFGGSRFHFPWMPFFALFAARLTEGWREGLAAARPRALAAGIAASAVFVLVWATEALLLAG
jgi:hypothetical protein